jgi:hypothetical protein
MPARGTCCDDSARGNEDRDRLYRRIGFMEGMQCNLESKVARHFKLRFGLCALRSWLVLADAGKFRTKTRFIY